MLCRKCGTEVKNTAKFCPGCGANVERKPASGGRPICPECGALVIEDAKFCKRCGAKVIAPAAQPEIKYCSCGAPLKAGVRFCKKCGAPVTASAPKPETPRCSCGAELKAGARFCKRCGAPASGEKQALHHIPAPSGATVTVSDGSNVWVCPECGMELPSKNAFCPECSLKATTMRQYLQGWVCPECRQSLGRAESCPDCKARAVQRESLVAAPQTASVPMAGSAAMTVSEQQAKQATGTKRFCPSCGRALSQNERHCPDCSAGAEGRASAAAREKNDRQHGQGAQRTPDRLRQKAGNVARQAAETVIPKVKAVIPKVKAIIPKVKAFIPMAKTAGKGVLEIESPAADTAGEMRMTLDSEQMDVLSSVARSLTRR